jgi:hypothetical protein
MNVTFLGLVYICIMKTMLTAINRWNADIYHLWVTVVIAEDICEAHIAVHN